MERFITLNCNLVEVFAKNSSTFELLVDGGVMHRNKVFSSEEELQQFI
jgi:DNA primase catalytic subunit